MEIARLALRRAACVGAFALGVAGCLFPSFDGMNDGTGAAAPDQKSQSGTLPSSESPADPTTPGKGTTSDGGSSTTGDATTSPSPDASTAPQATFNCGGDKRCGFGKEICCGHDWGKPECRSPQNVAGCDGYTHCGDSADCTGTANLCCYDKNTKVGTCKASCSGFDDILVCERNKPKCPNSKACNGVWFGLSYCI